MNALKRLGTTYLKQTLSIVVGLGCAFLFDQSAHAQVGLQEALETAQEKDAPTATLVGFRMTGPKSAMVYVNLTEVVSVSSAKNQSSLTFTLKNTKVKVSNNKNPLLAADFGSVVKSAQLVAAGKDTKLIILLTRTAKVSSKVVAEAGGAVLYVDLSEAVN